MSTNFLGKSDKFMLKIKVFFCKILTSNVLLTYPVYFWDLSKNSTELLLFTYNKEKDYPEASYDYSRCPAWRNHKFHI